MKIFIMGFLFTLTCFAQDSFDKRLGPSSFETQMQQGRLVTVSVTLGNPLKIFVSGKEEAKFNLNNLKLTVRRLDPYPGEELVFDKSGRYYTVPATQNGKTINELEVTTTIKGNTETFKFKLNNRKP
jgi:hypothetical protein